MPDTYTVNQLVPARRWTYPVVITLTDTNATKNLQTAAGIPYKYIQNTGASGLVNIFWMDGTTVDIWLNQGEVLEGGWWQNARTSGSSVGATALRGFIGMAGLGV